MTFALFQHLGATEIVLAFWVSICVGGAYISKTKNRPALEGALLGLFLGPLGLLVAVLLPTQVRRTEGGA